MRQNVPDAATAATAVEKVAVPLAFDPHRDASWMFDVARLELGMV